MKKWFILSMGAILLVFCIGLLLLHLQLSGTLSGVKTTVDIGDKVPDFSLKDCENVLHTLSKYSGKIVVLNFCSHYCPFSRGIDPEFNKLVQEYEDDDRVVFLGIDSHFAANCYAILQYARDNQIRYPILIDTENNYADSIGALVTPDIFVVAQDGTLAYRGAFDSRVIPDRVGDHAYTANAITALLEGKPVKPTRVVSWGCTIKRVKPDGI